MLAFVLRRILVSIPVLLAATFLVHTCVALSSDPLADLRTKNPPPSEATLQALAHRLHLDRNFFDRYLIWLRGVVTGDFGPSTRSLDIGQQLSTRLVVTLRMVFAAMLLAVLFAVVAGVVSASRQYSATDYSLTFFGFLFISMPVFWFAALLKTLALQVNAATGSSLKTLGAETPNLSGGFLAHAGDVLNHLALPTISLALISFAAWSRFQRASMLDVLGSDYMRLARAKGLSRGRVLVRHGLRTALIPLTTVVAIDVGAIFGGAVLTESVFAWHGMGELLTQGITSSDVNVVLAWLLVSGIFVIAFNLIADLLYAALDPRIRLA